MSLLSAWLSAWLSVCPERALSLLSACPQRVVLGYAVRLSWLALEDHAASWP